MHQSDNEKFLNFLDIRIKIFLKSLVDYIGGFDTTHIITTNINSEQHPTLPRNGHIRLEPLYA